MARRIVIMLLIIGAIGGGAWFYFSKSHNTEIGSLLNNPSSYAGKVVTVEGEVTDRSAFFNTIKFYKVKDKSGELIVSTKSKNLPGIKVSVTVKGKIDDSFEVGDQKLTVLAEESVEEKK